MTGNAILENCNCLYPVYLTIQISCVLIENSRIFRAVVVEKTEHESEGKVSCGIVSKFAASSQNALADSSSSEGQIIARDDIAQK